jgi:two-component system CheB/CheR fusion protein
MIAFLPLKGIECHWMDTPIMIDSLKNRVLCQELGDSSLSGENFNRILTLIGRSSGVDLSLYKEGTVKRRIKRRMDATQCGDIEDYIRLLEISEEEVSRLFSEILIGVTDFFRDPESFAILSERVIPEICRQDTDEQLRIWVVGCSMGQEAYSLAILFSEFLDSIGSKRQIKLFATDIHRHALEIASAGIFSEEATAGISPDRLSRYFVKKGSGYCVHSRIREQISFVRHNIACDPPFRRIDLISCRNLLIYFKPALQQTVFANFRFSLKQDSFLFLGSSESLGEQGKYYTPYSTRWKIFKNTGSVSERLKDKDVI